MIRTLIIEDESPAADRLEKMLMSIDPDITIIDKLDSVQVAIEWFHKNDVPDLVMLDIQLSDGTSFEIFKTVQIKSAIIFTTAYDEYAIRAFELNSIDYLLKPITRELLQKSIDKFKEFHPATTVSIDQQLLAQFIEGKNIQYKSRFLINIGAKLVSIRSSNVAYFYSLEKNTFLCTKEGKNYPIDFSLDKLEAIIDPEFFFRINRRYIIHYESIERILVLSKSKIKLNITPNPDEEILVSNQRASSFRKWLDR